MNRKCFKMKYLPVQKNRKYAYIDRGGNLVSEFLFKYADAFSEDIALVKYDNNEEWAINENFEKLFILPGYTYSTFSEGLLDFKLNKKEGYIDKTGKIVIPPQFDIACDFKNGTAVIIQKARRDKYGVIDKMGNWLINPDYACIVGFEEKYSIFSIEDGSIRGKWGLMDQAGKMLINAQYEHAINYREGLVGFLDKYDKYGYMDIGGNWIIKPQYDDAKMFENGCAAVGIDDKWGIINKSGDWIIDPVYTWTEAFSEGLAAVYVGGEWDYEYPVGGKWGFINIKGEMVIPPIFDCVTSFKDGISTVKVGDVAGDIDGKYKTGYIDINGNYIWEPSS